MEQQYNKKNTGLKIGMITRSDSSRLQRMLQTTDGVESIYVATDIKDFLRKQKQAMVSCSIILMDATVCSTTEVRNVPMLRTHIPDLRIIGMLNAVRRDDIIQVIATGADACILQGENTMEIRKAIISVKNGKCYLSPTIIRELFNHIAEEMSEQIWSRLTFMERKIVTAVAEESLPLKIAALKLNTSNDTIRFHLKNIYRKLKIHSAGELAKKFYMEKYGPMKNANDSLPGMLYKGIL